MTTRRGLGLWLAMFFLTGATCYAQEDSAMVRVRYEFRAALPVQEDSPPLFLSLVEALQSDAHAHNVHVSANVNYEDAIEQRQRAGANVPHLNARTGASVAHLNATYEFASFREFRDWYTNASAQGHLENIRADYNASNIHVNLYVIHGEEPKLNPMLDDAN